MLYFRVLAGWIQEFLVLVRLLQGLVIIYRSGKILMGMVFINGINYWASELLTIELDLFACPFRVLMLKEKQQVRPLS